MLRFGKHAQCIMAHTNAITKKSHSILEVRTYGRQDMLVWHTGLTSVRCILQQMGSYSITISGRLQLHFHYVPMYDTHCVIVFFGQWR